MKEVFFVLHFLFSERLNIFPSTILYSERGILDFEGRLYSYPPEGAPLQCLLVYDLPGLTWGGIERKPQRHLAPYSSSVFSTHFGGPSTGVLVTAPSVVPFPCVHRTKEIRCHKISGFFQHLHSRIVLSALYFKRRVLFFPFGKISR